MWDFRRGHPAFDVSYTVPSRCAAELAQGTADIGIIPSAAYGTIPDLAIVPGIVIASKSSVRSILLVSKVPLEEIRTIALDNSSLTSVALVQILFAKWWAGNPLFATADPDLPAMLTQFDAALVIGDTALQVDRSRYMAYDLAEEWIKFTGKPFVFAFWAVRRVALDSSSGDCNLISIFQRSRDNGLRPESLDQIAKEWAPRLNLTESDVKSYLCENIHYQLDRDCLEGLNLFYEYAEQCGIFSRPPELRFVESEKLAAI
jgi:chorismate dehydratase